MLVPLKYISVFNYGYDVLMINQWRHVEEIICPENESIYVIANCVSSGSEILQNSKIDAVSNTQNNLYKIHSYYMLFFYFVSLDFAEILCGLHHNVGCFAGGRAFDRIRIVEFQESTRERF